MSTDLPERRNPENNRFNLFDELAVRTGETITVNGCDYTLTHIVGSSRSTVYRAVRQPEGDVLPFAVKIVPQVRPGDDGRPPIGASEWQILAGLKHPHIIKYTAAAVVGTDLCIVQELCEGGRPFVAYCDERKSSLRSRLKLFLQVCDAIAFAHAKGVIHRDVKPANILVGDADPPSAQVVDFGIATLLNSQWAAAELQPTDEILGQGTRAYCSPEQLAGMTPAFTDDVYALGVVLHELLVGSWPDRIAGVIARPSVSVLADGKALTAEEVSRNRGTQPQRLARDLRGDLDDIVLKALAPKEERYPSVSDLRDDIQRHLTDHPVRVRQTGLATPLYRLGKFARRHPTAGPLAAVAVVLLAAAIVFAVRWVAGEQRVRAAEQAARVAAEGQRDDALRSQGRLAVAYFDLARSRARQSPAEAAPAIYQDALAGVDALLWEQPENRTVLHLKAKILNNLGAAQRLVGRRDLARAKLRAAEDILSQLTPPAGGEPEVATDTANCLGNQANVAHDDGDLDRAKGLYDRAVAEIEKVAEEYPDEPAHRGRLAKLLADRGRLWQALGRGKESRDDLTRALDLWGKLLAADPPGEPWDDTRAQAANARILLALLDTEEKKYQTAEDGYRLALRALAKLVKDRPTVVEYHLFRAAGVNNLGLHYTRSGQARKAADLFEAMAEEFDRLARLNPGDWQFHFYRAVCLVNRGEALLATGAPADDIEAVSLAARKLLTDLPFPSPQTRVQLARTHRLSGELAHDRSDWATATAQYEKARMILAAVHTDHSYLDGVAADLAGVERLLGIVALVTGQSDEARKLFTRAHGRDETLERQFSHNGTYKENLAADYDLLGRWEHKYGTTAESVAAYDKAEQILLVLRKANPDADRPRTLLRQLYLRRAAVRVQTRRALALTGLWVCAGIAGSPFAPPCRDEQAEKDWALAVGLETPHCPDPLVRIERAKYRLGVGDLTPAEEDLVVLDRCDQLTPDDRYDLACLHSIAYGRSALEKGRDRHANAVIVLLRALHGEGYFRSKAIRDHFLRDRDFDPVRRLPEYRTIDEKIRQDTE